MGRIDKQRDEKTDKLTDRQADNRTDKKISAAGGRILDLYPRWAPAEAFCCGISGCICVWLFTLVYPVCQCCLLAVVVWMDWLTDCQWCEIGLREFKHNTCLSYTVTRVWDSHLRES